MEFNETRPYGIEVEGYGIDRYRLASALANAGIPAAAEGYGHRTSEYWKVTTDATIHGSRPFELVSPKLYGQAGLDTIKRVLKIVRELGGTVNRSCGLHVHHSAQGLSPKQMKMVSHFYSALFPCFDGIFALSRHNSEWCRLADPREINRVRERDLSRMNRYQAVNLAAFFRHGTIEFRQHHGTVNATKVINWIVFTQQMMLGALRSKKAVSWRTKNFRVGLFNFWRLYDKDTTLDTICEGMLRYVAKRTGWRVGKIIKACRQRAEAQAQAEGFESAADMTEADAGPIETITIPPVRTPQIVGERCQCDACQRQRARVAAQATVDERYNALTEGN